METYFFMFLKEKKNHSLKMEKKIVKELNHSTSEQFSIPKASLKDKSYTYKPHLHATLMGSIRNMIPPPVSYGTHKVKTI
mgnify:CR=1 FL=1